MPDRKKNRILTSMLLTACMLAGLTAGLSEKSALILPNGLSIIDSGAFMNDKSITGVTIPGQTISIGDYAFYGCANLTEAIIENDDTVIGENAFAGCSENLIIYGYSDESLAKDYALANGIKFEPIWSWSDWTTIAPAEGVTAQSKTQYRSRTIGTQTVYSDWSAWQSNGSTPVDSSVLREVKTVSHAAVIKTIYHYNRYNYTDASGTTHLSYADGYANSMGFSGYWQYKDSGSKLPDYKIYDESHQAYGSSSDFWFNESTTQQTETAAYTEYQYRTRTASQETVYGMWTAWQDTEIKPSQGIQAESRKVYRTFGKTSEQTHIGEPVNVAEGMYIIRAASGNVIDAYLSHHTEHTKLNVREGNGGNNQKFVLNRQSDDWYLIQAYDGLTMGFDGSEAQLLSVTSSSTLRWRFLSAGTAGYYYIENGSSGYLSCSSDGIMVITDCMEDAVAWMLSGTRLEAPSLENDAVSNFAAGNISQTGAIFTWTDVIGADTFNIHIYREGSEIYTAVNAVSGYTYTFLSPDTTYTARLEAINSAGSGLSAIKTFTTKSNLPVVGFSQTSITVNENLAFNIDVEVINYNNRSLAVSMTTTDPKIDVVETKFTGPDQTLKTLFQAGIIREIGGGYSNSADLQDSSSRTFYLSSGSGTLHIGGNYIRSSDTVTLTINNSPDGTYTVGPNNTCVIHYIDVDADKPDKNNYSSKDAYVSACAVWLNAKFPSGKYWNHPVGTICDDNNITSVSCTERTHGPDNAIYSEFCFNRGVMPGDSICTNFAHYNSAQCMGFALKVGKDIFGSSAMTSSWTNIGKPGDNLQPGDIVRVTDHSMFILSVSGSTVQTLECNNGGNCIIYRHTRTFSEGTIDGMTIVHVRRVNNWK